MLKPEDFCSLEDICLDMFDVLGCFGYFGVFVLYIFWILFVFCTRFLAFTSSRILEVKPFRPPKKGFRG